MSIRIVDIEAKDIRFPTSRSLDGSDAMNPDPDYSAAYVILKTDQPAKSLPLNREVHSEVSFSTSFSLVLFVHESMSPIKIIGNNI